MNILHQTEAALGRLRDPQCRYAPRQIDLDLLLFGHMVTNDPELTLPHPRMFERAFVLVPLADIDPDLIFPDGQTIKSALAGLTYKIIDNLILQ